ncbi:hypothetical protein HanXRQr2_Chr16g0749091 [Helianthus annuus]|uniref:Uncharacterized protein n=1 Tax=Helianthus annuus TaxID=4232 RepID=A0A9K3DRA4_HELAN|nr:hypothetical protein HanXRQr2_Chr16g0749091 [Helianthus annuus]KAJ0460509.1 hypothetical protein HanHA89_Chr16g0661621 [Helianthus annuus]
MASRNRSKTSGEGSSSRSALAKWEQLCTLPDIDDKLFRLSWDWSRYNDAKFGARWDEDQSKSLHKFNHKQTEVKLWRYKMAQVTNPIDKLCVFERLVNSEEFQLIGVTQKFERLGWERVLDWVEGATPKVYLKAVIVWLSTLRLENAGENPVR